MSNNISVVYLMLSEDCNLKCTYCYEKQSQRVEKTRMSLNILDKSLSYLSTNYNVGRLILFGGEPTLNMDAVIKAFKDAPENLPITLITNGIIIDDELLELIKNRKRTVIQVSLDGNFSSMKDRVGNNKTLFDKIVNNAKKYKQVCDPNNFFFHIAVTKTNIDKLYENVMFLLSLELEANINTTPDFNGDWDIYDYFIYENQMTMLKDYALINKTSRIRPITNNIGTESFTRGCPAGIHNILINPQGNIYPCSRMYTSFGDRFKMGNVHDNFPVDNSFYKNLDFSKSKCGNCSVSGCVICIAANLEKTGKLTDCNPAHCKISIINNKISKEYKNNIVTQ